MNNFYNQISELLLNEDVITTQKPREADDDLIVEKPYLFYYLNKTSMNDKVKTEGVYCDNKEGVFRCYFTRVPETLPKYKEFLDNHIPLKISLSKLKRVIDGFQVTGKNLGSIQDGILLTDNVINQLCKQKEEMFKQFESLDLDSIPMAILRFNKNIMPAFIYKIIGDDEDNR